MEFRLQGRVVMPEMTVWNDLGGPAEFKISREAAEQLRLAAIDGLLSLRRVGVGIGGLLLGHREGAVVKVLEARPLACSHAMGPSFVLTPEETEAALAMARQTGPLIVVGCYCSKPRGFAPLTESDRALYETLCPEPWQVMLFIRPSTVEPSRTRLWSRDRAGTPVQGPERELKRFDPAAAEVEPAAMGETPRPAPVPQFAPRFAASAASNPQPDRSWEKAAAVSFLVIIGAMTLFYLLLNHA